MAIVLLARSSVVGRHLLFTEDAGRELAIDDADLAFRAELEGVGSDAVDVAETAVGLLVDEGEGVGGEELAVGSGAFEAESQVLGGVAGRGFAEGEPAVDARPERAVLGQGEPLASLWQAVSRPVFQRTARAYADAHQPPGGIRLGQRVRHGKFGEGVVLNSEGSGAHARVQVNFEQSGTKWLVVAYANLELM